MKSTSIKPRRLRAIAKIARKCGTKKEMAALLKGDELTEALRIQQIQKARAALDGPGFTERYLVPQKLDSWDRKGIKRSAWKTTRRWHWAREFRYGFAQRIADRIKQGWTYDTQGKTHSLHLHHSQSVEIKCTRPACSYTVMSTRLSFPLLTHEAVWIGGLLTIRAKADAGKPDYDCHWLELRPGSPGLVVKQGRILNHNFHTEFDAKGRPRARAINRPAAGAPRLPRGWVNRDSSLRAGNCPNGTDHFITTKLIPHLASLGFAGLTFQRVRDCAFRLDMVLQLQRDTFTLRLAKAA